jgi:hypothetical protein
MEVQPSHLIPSLPPSEGEMAAWLCPVVRGDELVVTGPDDPTIPGDFVAGHATDEQQKQRQPTKRRRITSGRTIQRRRRFM